MTADEKIEYLMKQVDGEIRCLMNDWEKDFIETINEYPHGRDLTIRQLETLDQIYSERT